MKTAVLFFLFPLLGNCAALPPDALSAFRQPGVPTPLYAKVVHGDPLNLVNLITLSRAEVSRGAIIDYLYSFGRHFNLTAADISELRREGVGADLIDYMTSPSAHPSKFDF